MSTLISVDYRIAPELPESARVILGDLTGSKVVRIRVSDIELYGREEGTAHRPHFDFDRLIATDSSIIELDLRVAESFMRNQHMIPQSWETDERGNRMHVYFGGTRIKQRDGRERMPYLHKIVGQWQIDWGVKEYYWMPLGFRAVLRRK